MKPTIFVFLAVIMLSGCGNVEGYVVAKALYACESHRGLHEIVADAWYRHAECNDGQIFYNLETRMP